jgi:hypothetical protein
MGKGSQVLFGSGRPWMMVSILLLAACDAQPSAHPSSSFPASSSPNVVASSTTLPPSASATVIATTPSAAALLDSASAVVSQDRFIKATRATNGVQEAIDNAGKLVVDPIDLTATLGYAVPDRLSSHISGGSDIIRIGTSWWTSGPDGRRQARQGPAVSIDLNTLLSFNRAQYSLATVQGPVSCGTSMCWSLSAGWTTTLRPTSRISSVLLIDLKTTRLASEVHDRDL